MTPDKPPSTPSDLSALDPLDADAVACMGASHRGPCVIASGNGIGCVGTAYRTMRSGTAPVEAAVAGVAVVEDDPGDVSVGYGGLPNASGEVECDAAVMDAQTHAVGAVGAIRNIRHAGALALAVMRHCDHSLLVGEGALAFARTHGFPEEDLVTESSRAAWQRWIEAGSPSHQTTGPLSDEDRWENLDTHGDRPDFPTTTGTVHCSVLDTEGRLGSCTSTSGLSYKLPGRVGDSPIIGAGLYADRGVGAAGATGRGESAMDNCAAYAVVCGLGRGLDPADACLEVLRCMVARTRQPRLLDASKRPGFNVTLYALRADGAFGSAAIWSGYRFAVCDESGPRVVASRFLYERPPRPIRRPTR